MQRQWSVSGSGPTHLLVIEVRLHYGTPPAHANGQIETALESHVGNTVLLP